ncbi:hypothetical protein TorRG33x02_333120 [Trema orientale]|uniref:Transmembrane protein n=1 Tax=Trema orientale TaxID=63057 RepID=A0A2P5B4R4_TREOI|nr:hypothetical protein TorRG33x02_333120 [Trema orientale]
MGFTISTLSLIILFLVVVSSSTTSTTLPSSSPSSTSHEVKLGAGQGGGATGVRYRVFYLKNTTPFHNTDRVRGDHQVVVVPTTNNKKNKNKKTTTILKRKKVKNLETTSRPAFSVMLPKGFVPPSGSSPCHNENPNSVVFFCATSPKP